MPRFISVLLRILLGLVLLVVLAVGVVLVALRVPSVQTRVAQRAATFLTDKLGQRVSVGRVDIRPFSRVLLQDVQVLDRRGGELFNIGRAEADIKLFSLLNPRHLHVGQLVLNEPRFALVTYADAPDSTNLSQFLAAVRRLVGPTDTTKVKQPFDFQIESLGLRNGRFVLERQDKPRTEYGVDYAHMRVDSIYADFSGIQMHGDTIITRIRDMRAVETPSKTRVQHMDTDMTFAPTFWEFANTDLRVGNSYLKDYVRFDYKRFLNFTHFNDSVRVTARLGTTKLTSDDIAHFAPQLRDLNETVVFSGEAKGYVKNFTTRNLDIRYGQNTHVVGSVNVEGLPNVKESFVEMRLQPSVIDGRDIRKYVPAKGWAYVQRLGTVKLKGQFLGFYNDFVANGAFQTALGNVESDVNIKFKTDPRYSTYEGQVKTTGFELGKFLGDQRTVRDIAFSGRVEGVGFTPTGARLRANATVQSIWLNGYRFRNITTNGQFSRETFEGKLAINDRALQVSADGRVDLNKSRQAFDLRAVVRRADLRALDLTEQAVTIATKADLRFQGLKLDDLIGRIMLRETKLSYAGRNVAIDTFDLTSQRLNGQRRLAVRSEVANLTASGNFDFTTVARDVQTLLTEYQLNFESNDTETANYYRRKRQGAISEYAIDLDLYLKRANPVLQLFVPKLEVANYSRLEGSFRNGSTSIFTLAGQFDSTLR